MNKQNQGRYRGAEDVSNSNQRKPFPTKPFVCGVCKFATTKSGYLKKHEKRHLPVNKDEASHSSFGNQEQGDFNPIMPNNTNSKTLLCTKCIDSGDSCAMNKHRKNQCPLNKFKCTECKFTTSVEGYLRTHIKNKHDPSRFHCNHCSFNTPDEGNWKLHQLRHLKPLPVSFKCKECGFCTDSKNSLKRHVIKKHATFQCTQCPFSTQDEGEWNMHQMKHLKPLQYKCTECDFCTDEKDSLKSHEIKDHGSQIFRCNHCSFTTRFEPTLTRHNEIHPDKPIKCANCDFIAVCERSLKIHQETQCQPCHFEYKPNSVVQTNDQLFLKYNMIRALSGQFNNFRSFNVENPVKTSLDASAVSRALSSDFPDYQQHPQCATLSTDFDPVQMSQGSSWSLPKTADHGRFETLTNMEAIRGVTSASSSVKEEHEEVLDYRCTTITGDVGNNRQSMSGVPPNVR